MLALGAFLTFTYSKPIEVEKIFAQGVATVPAGMYKAVLYDQAASGSYIYELSSINGTIRAIIYSENLTDEWNNGKPPLFPFNNYGSSTRFTNSFSTNIASPQYLVFFNSDSYGIEISYKVFQNLKYMNYFGLVAGLACVIVGSAMAIMAALRKKLVKFNNALELGA